MGCHTWYKKLVTNNQEEIKIKVREIITKSEYNWYEFTNIEDLFESDEEWVEEIFDYVCDFLDIIKVNGIWGIYDYAEEFGFDEPRIGGYPETIITSADEMFKVMETGLVGVTGGYFNFYWNKERDEEIRNNIREFFKIHPNGIIEFG